MTTAAELCATLLSSTLIDDERFFEATALLATRFDRRGDMGDLRSDEAAPGVIYAWFSHADERVPDLRVWDLSCQIEAFFDPECGLVLPSSWLWDTRDRLLRMNARLRARSAWRSVFERALLAPDSGSVRALACCAAEGLGVDPFPILWGYLCEHIDDGNAWHLLTPKIDDQRLPEFLTLARQKLLGPASTMPAWHSQRDIQGHPQQRVMRREAQAFIWHEVLELLRRFVGSGLYLIEVALMSSDLGVRAHALEVLTVDWYELKIPFDTRNLLRELAESETDASVRRRLEALVQGT